jgi:HEAT repeat protein
VERRWLSNILVSDAGSEADLRERLSDEDEGTRKQCVRNLAEGLGQRTIYLPRLRDMLARDPSDEVRAALIDALAEDPPSRDPIRNILSATIRLPGMFSDYLSELQGAAIRALATDPESEELVRAYVNGPKFMFLGREKHPLQKLVGIPRWRQMLLRRLDSPDVSPDEVKIFAGDLEAEESLKRLLDSPRDDIVHASVEALGERADRSRLIQLLDNDNETLRCAAISALGKHLSTEPILRRFLTKSAHERIAAAKALIGDAASLGSIQENLLRHPEDDVRRAAIEVLSAHPIAFAALREYFEEIRPRPEHEWITDETGYPVNSRSHENIRGQILEALARDPRYYGLVESSLDDPHPPVRVAAVRALAGDSRMVDRLKHLFYSDSGGFVQETIIDLMPDQAFVREHLLWCLHADLGALRFSAFRYLVDHLEDRKKMAEMLSSPAISEDLRETIVGPLMRDPGSVDLVRACIDDESIQVREQALRLLRHDRRVRQQLRERARSKEWLEEMAQKSFFRNGVPSVLGSDPEAHPILASYLALNDNGILTFVAHMLRDYPQARRRLAELLDHSSVTVQSAAMRALGAYEPVRMRLVAALAPDPPFTREPDTDMMEVIHRSSALRTLRRAAADALKDVPEHRTEFRALLDNEDKVVRAAAIHSVSADRTPEARPLLRERLGAEEDEDLRFRIIEALRGDPGSVEPLRDRLHNDYKRAVRKAAANALGFGDLSPAYAVSELPSVARIRGVLAGVVAPELTALHAFLKCPRRLDLDAEPGLGEEVLAWSCARLTWAYELERDEDGQVLGEVAGSVERFTRSGGVILIRVAMDTFSLPYERFLRPNHNLMEVWEIARHLVALDPPTVSSRALMFRTRTSSRPPWNRERCGLGRPSSASESNGARAGRPAETKPQTLRPSDPHPRRLSVDHANRPASRLTAAA